MCVYFAGIFAMNRNRYDINSALSRVFFFFGIHIKFSDQKHLKLCGLSFPLNKVSQDLVSDFVTIPLSSLLPENFFSNSSLPEVR